MLREVDLHGEFSSVLLDFAKWKHLSWSWLGILLVFTSSSMHLEKAWKIPLIVSFLSSLPIKWSEASSFCKRWLYKASRGQSLFHYWILPYSREPGSPFLTMDLFSCSVVRSIVVLFHSALQMRVSHALKQEDQQTTRGDDTPLLSDNSRYPLVSFQMIPVPKGCISSYIKKVICKPLVNVNADDLFRARPAPDVCDSCTFGHAVDEMLEHKYEMHWSAEVYKVHQTN